MDVDELGQIIAALHGHAKWLRNYAAKPREYINPVPMTPDELDRIADRLAEIINKQQADR